MYLSEEVKERGLRAPVPDLVKRCAQLCDSHCRIQGAVGERGSKVPRIEGSILRDMGLGWHRMVSVPIIGSADEDYLLAWSARDRLLYIAVLGTEAVKMEWLLNMFHSKTTLRVAAGQEIYGVSSGFEVGAREVLRSVLSNFLSLGLGDPTGGANIVVTGHSRGGAIAQVIALALKMRGYKINHVVTFGQPKTGGPEFAAFYRLFEIPTTRVRHLLDPVPYLPLFKSEHTHKPLTSGLWGHRIKLYNRWRGR